MAGGGGGGFGFPMGGGGLGIGTIVVLGIIGYALGIDPRLLIGGAEMLSAAAGRAISSRARPSGKTGAPSDDMGKFVSRDSRLAPTCSGSRSSSKPGSATARRPW